MQLMFTSGGSISKNRRKNPNKTIFLIWRDAVVTPPVAASTSSEITHNPQEPEDTSIVIQG